MFETIKAAFSPVQDPKTHDYSARMSELKHLIPSARTDQERARLQAGAASLDGREPSAATIKAYETATALLERLQAEMDEARRRRGEQEQATRSNCACRRSAGSLASAWWPTWPRWMT
jgi:hypothetical protein